MDRNQASIVNDDEREREHTTYTSQVAEAHIEAFMHARHKKTGKMPWSRAGADNVLHIRATMASKDWASTWQSTVLSALGAAASKEKCAIYSTLPDDDAPRGMSYPSCMVQHLAHESFADCLELRRIAPLQ
jgi:hypothetical protein